MAILGTVIEIKTVFSIREEARLNYELATGENIVYKNLETGFSEEETVYILTVRRAEGFKSGN